MEERELTENEQKKLFLRSYLRDKQAVIQIEEQLAMERWNKKKRAGGKI